MFESELENLLGEFRIKMKGEIRKGMWGGVRAYFKILNHTKQVYEFEFAMLRSLCSNPGKLCVEMLFSAWQVWQALLGCVQEISMR